MSEGFVGLSYVAMTFDDLEEVLDIERASFSAPWTPDLFITEFENPLSRRRVAKVGGRVVGFLIYWLVADEAHLMNVAVAPEARRRGVGRFLVERLVRECRESGARGISLEVRRSNEPAIGLYMDFGFKAVGLRKRYYTDNNEDAILMDLELT